MNCTQLHTSEIQRFPQVVEFNGAGDRDRTGDIQLGKLAFYR